MKSAGLDDLNFKLLNHLFNIESKIDIKTYKKQYI